MAPLPQFPIGSVLFPTMLLPLHVFEPRYRELMMELMVHDDPADREFGVPLIERGSEVGGGEDRSDVGCVARIMEAEQYEDGRWGLVAVGVRRYRVNAWLPDDPYPLADVDDWPDDDPTEDPTGPFLDMAVRLRRVLALAAEAGIDVGTVPDLVDDPGLGSFQASVLAPVGPHDKQRLLTAAGPTERIALLHEVLGDTEELLTLQLGQG